jgi:hypothetical protein
MHQVGNTGRLSIEVALFGIHLYNLEAKPQLS